jgi:hypothetical protein
MVIIGRPLTRLLMIAKNGIIIKLLILFVENKIVICFLWKNFTTSDFIADLLL